MSLEAAPKICPYWDDGRHGEVRVWVWRRLRRRIVSVCPRCGGWWREIGTLSGHRRLQRQQHVLRDEEIESVRRSEFARR